MFDFLRNLTKTAEEKRQEAVAAYLDEALSNRARQRFEQEMAQDETLRLEVEQLLLIKQSLRQLPQRKVPRNFILDPAQYSRPARQPWVQAYPVLRAATAMTAFFLLFAFVAGVFTGLGAGEPALAPAADVAQIESTQVIAETAEPQVFEFGEAEDEGREPPAEEEAMEEEVATYDVLTEETMEEEDAAESAAAPSAATAVPSPANSIEGVTAEDDASDSEPTATVSPTPTVSLLPRVESPTPLPDRDMDEAAGGEAASEVAAEVAEPDDDTTDAQTTAVLPEEEVHMLSEERAAPFNPLLTLQIGLGLLLLLLFGLTLYARRQR